MSNDIHRTSHFKLCLNRALVCDPVNAIVPKCDAKIRTRDSCGAEFLLLLPFEYFLNQKMIGTVQLLNCF